MTTENAVPAWGETTVKLMFPLTTPDGSKIETITLREPTAEGLETIEAQVKPDAPQSRVMRYAIATMSGLAPETLLNLNARDLVALSEASGPLLEAIGLGRTTYAR